MTDTATDLAALREAACPGPYYVVWPQGLGGAFLLMGKQGTRAAGFTDGWAIPLVASGTQSNMEYIAALLNREMER